MQHINLIRGHRLVKLESAKLLNQRASATLSRWNQVVELEGTKCELEKMSHGVN